MEYTQLIHEYLDGELGAELENILFSQLALNPELRNDFNHQVKLQIITQNDLGTITTPIECTNAVFSSLGFAIPTTSYKNSINDLPKSLFNRITTNTYFKNILTAVVSVSLTALVFLFFINNESEPLRKGSLANSDKIPSVSSFENIEGSKFNIFDYAFSTPSDNDLSSNNKMIKSNLSSVPNENKIVTFNDNDIRTTSNLSQNQNLDIASNLNNSIDVQSSFNNKIGNSNSHTNLINQTILNKIFSNKKPIDFDLDRNSIDDNILSLQIRGIAANSSPSLDQTSEQTTKNWFNNLAVSLAYRVDKNEYWGLEVGQEEFVKEYSKQVAPNKYDNIKENPLLFWYGVFYNPVFTDLSIIDDLYPYAQGFFGGTNLGPLVKIQFGLQYKPDKMVQFKLGLEGTGLLYSVQNEYYLSKKYGITYGVSINY